MSYKILVVDDTKFMRKMAADYLKQFDYRVVGEASNGKDAIHQYKKLQPDITMMDITMPEMNGIEATKEILKINPDAVILVCSAGHQQDLIFDALDAGAIGYLMKPFNPERMNEIIIKYAVPLLTKLKDTPEIEAAQEEVQELDESHAIAFVEEQDLSLEEVDSEVETVAVENDEVTDEIEPVEEEEEISSELQEESLEDAQEEGILVSKQTEEEKIIDESNKGRNKLMKGFVKSYMCNWQEDINDDTSNFAVTFTENEEKITIEMTNENNEKQAIQFSLEGFIQLNNWLGEHMKQRA